MTKIMMHGCLGQMGQTITRLVSELEDVSIVAGIDMREDNQEPYPIYRSLLACKEQGDVVIDFSNAKAIDRLIEECVELNLPLVLCTTGLSEVQLSKVEAAAKVIPILKSANMSLGINTLLSLVKEAAKILYPAGFDMEIIERHHRLKVDAPSGTALALADALREGIKEDIPYIYDRSLERKAREKAQIGMSAIRGGNIVGEHEVLFAGEDEEIIFSHKATSKAIFGKGAIEAAKFLAHQSPGLYSMSDVIADKQLR